MKTKNHHPLESLCLGGSSPHHLLTHKAFSLVEVSLALAIVGVAMVSILGLFVVGVDAVRDGNDDSMAAQLVQAVVNDRRSTGYNAATPALSDTSFNIPALSNKTAWPYILYFKKAGGIPVADLTPSHNGWAKAGYYYEVDVDRNKASTNQVGLCMVDIRVSWPTSIGLSNRTTYFFTTAISSH